MLTHATARGMGKNFTDYCLFWPYTTNFDL